MAAHIYYRHTQSDCIGVHHETGPISLIPTHRPYVTGTCGTCIRILRVVKASGKKFVKRKTFYDLRREHRAFIKSRRLPVA